MRCCTRLPISAQCFANFSISCSIADSVGRALKVLRVMMTVDAIKQFDGHTEKTSRFPFVDAGLHNHSTWRAEQSTQCCRRARRHNSCDDLIIRTWRRSARTTQSEHCMWQFAIDILNTDDPSSILRKNVLWSRRLRPSRWRDSRHLCRGLVGRCDQFSRYLKDLHCSDRLASLVHMP